MKPGKWSLNGSDWLMKEFVGLDWVWRNSVMPKGGDARWWYPAKAPGAIAHDLRENGLIPDPYFECNSKLAEWVSARTWVYKKEFIPPKEFQGEKVTLCFEGIDYQSEIFLNGISLGHQEGMFVPFEVSVEDKIKYGEKNLLAVVIEPAPQEQPQVGKTSLVRTHKSRMTYWWDFCPRLVHQGIWQDVYLKVTGREQIRDVQIKSSLKEDGQAEVTVTVWAVNGGECRMQVSFGDASITCREEGNVFKAVFQIKEPRLWWCNGQGEPYEYPLEIFLYNREGKLSDSYRQMYGIREIRFEQNENTPDERGRFLFKLNGRTVFINGYNWVPADMLYGAITRERTDYLIYLARKAGVNMLRVWGGGLIERDSFYQKCAQEGILVWQEFILSSSGIENRPSQEDEYLKMMERQAEIIIKKKRNHTALALWCGGNELQESDGTPLTDAHPLLKMLQGAVEKWDQGRRWLPTSPSGGVFLNSMENLKEHPEELFDVHGPWEHQGLNQHYKLYNAGRCRLHSEFGVEGMTNYMALRKTTLPEHFLPASKDNPVYFHRGAWWNNEPLVQESFGGGLKDVEQIRKASQYLQYEGLKYAMEADRHRAFSCSGIFPWQLNEPFPNLFCTSVVDYYGSPKPAYYGAKRAYASWLVSAAFEGAALTDGKLTADIYAARNLPDDALCKDERYHVDVRLYNMAGRVLWEETMTAEGISQKAVHIGAICWEAGKEESGLFLLRLRLKKQEDGLVLSENEYLFTKEKDFSEVFGMDKPVLDVQLTDGAVEVENCGGMAALFLFLSKEEGERVLFEDNYFTLLPGEVRKVRAEGNLDFLSLSALNCDWGYIYESSCGN